MPIYACTDVKNSVDGLSLCQGSDGMSSLKILFSPLTCPSWTLFWQCPPNCLTLYLCSPRPWMKNVAIITTLQSVEAFLRSLLVGPVSHSCSYPGQIVHINWSVSMIARSVIVLWWAAMEVFHVLSSSVIAKNWNRRALHSRFEYVVIGRDILTRRCWWVLAFATGKGESCVRTKISPWRLGASLSCLCSYSHLENWGSMYKA